MQVSATVNLDYRTHDERDDLDGWSVSLGPVLRYALDSRTLLEAGPQLEAVDAREDHRAIRLVGFGIGMSRAFENGFARLDLRLVSVSKIWSSRSVVRRAQGGRDGMAERQVSARSLIDGGVFGLFDVRESALG